ncbi:MAG TPA: hypothetical protein PLE99_05265 [Candidatus Thiothrix moscowensis]|uniref:hypothetical protein n=1 Tax=unclassified Thiothrix TaxID=2636184 RepID=UPI001A2B7B49|nr:MULTISPECIES: hypothetical protein [unclassified Thiothrix]MBJ6609209.1 hypothetical protein [Candidatus Thiothrix moscowensis]HRJ52154.1 hypothetical protein [Candidatus Thiothrix moscowensis]HRJ92335.1 hypothetical protein [Candidatus Thiothrix moscowensis]
MQLRIQINDTTRDIDVPQFVLDEADDFFTQMDRDMDRGYQMSRLWVDNPDQEQRCQIVADKILTALSNGNQKSGTLMAAYILKRMPHIREIHLNTEGDISGHDLL